MRVKAAARCVWNGWLFDPSERHVYDVPDKWGAPPSELPLERADEADQPAARPPGADTLHELNERKRVDREARAAAREGRRQPRPSDQDVGA